MDSIQPSCSGPFGAELNRSKAPLTINFTSVNIVLDQKTFLMAIFYFQLILTFFFLHTFISLFIQQLLCDHNVPDSVLETKNSNVYKTIFLMEATAV